MPPAPKNVEQRFWSLIDKPDEQSCWTWTGYKMSNGYGTFRLNAPRRKVLAHRWMWQLFHGPIPEGLHCCHHCDNPSCVNPRHLFLGTDSDNVKDKIQKGRQPRGFIHWRTHLTDNDVKTIRDRKGHMTQKQLAHIYGVSRECISSIQQFRVWKHIQGT